MKKWGLALCAVLLIGFIGTINLTNAKEVGQIEISIQSLIPTKLTYSIESTDTYDNALLIVALYENGRLVDTTLNSMNIENGSHSFSQTLSCSFDQVKIMLVDADTLILLCNGANQTLKTVQIQFLDYDNSILSQQEIYAGQSAELPQNPSRDGFIFVGWDKDTSVCNEDMTVSAQYAPEDAENIFSLSSVSGQPGDTVTVLLNLTGTIKLCGFDMRLLYDKDILEFVSLDSELSMEVVANHVASSNSIRFNFSSKQNRKIGGGILSATFRIKDSDAKNTVVRLQPISVICADDNGELLSTNYITTEGEIFIQ